MKLMPRLPEPREIGALLFGRVYNRFQAIDLAAIRAARAVERDREFIRASGITGTWNETIYQNVSDFTANANTSAETSLLAGTNNDQPLIPALFFNYKNAFGRKLRITARGVLSTTSTPTIIFQLRIGTTSGSSFLSGTSIGVSAAITTASGVTNQIWELRFEVTCRTPGQGAGNTTLVGSGLVHSPGGFASPFAYAMLPTTPPTGTWTATIDNLVNQYLNLSTTWSAANASNTITCKELTVEGMN